MFQIFTIRSWQARTRRTTVSVSGCLCGLVIAGNASASSPPECRSSQAVTIPVQIISNLPFMQGRVNGSRSLSVILDTGAALTIVSPEVANEVDLKSAKSVQAGGFGKGSDQTLHLVNSAALAWGSADTELRLSNEQIAVLPIDYIGAQVGRLTDALFGSNVFQHFRVALDYERQKVSFASFDEPCTPNAQAIPIDIVGNAPVVDAEIASRDGTLVKARFLVDIGTTGAAILSKQFLAAHPEVLAGRSLVASPPFSAVGGKIESKLVRLSRLRFGGYDLDEPVAVIPEQASGLLANPQLAGLLGGEILNRFTVTWDYRSRRMWLVPNSRLNDPFRSDASGLHLIAKGPGLSQVYVDAVLPGSPASRAGVRAGDRVISINNKPRRLWQMVRDLTLAGSTATFALRRDGKLLRLTVLLEKLI